MPDDDGGRPRLLIARAPASASVLVAAAQARGWEAEAIAAIATAPADPAPVEAALARLAEFDLIAFTSANAVRAVAARAHHAPADAWRGITIAAVGPATARALAGALRAPDVIAEEHGALGLAAAIGDVSGRRVLLPRGDLARDELPVALAAGGARVDEVIAYHTVPHDDAAEIARRLRQGAADAILFYSPSAVLAVEAALAGWTGERPEAFCIGPTTASAAREAGFALAPLPDRADDASLLDSMDRWLATRRA